MLFVGVVAHRRCRPLRTAGAHLAGAGFLHGHHRAQVVGPVGVDAKARVPGQPVALDACVGVLIEDIGGPGRRAGGAAGEQVDVRCLARVLEGEDMALQLARAQHDLAEHGVVAVVLRVWAGAGAIGRVVAAHVVQCVGLAARGRQHPLQAVAGLGGNGAGGVVAMVILAPARGHAPAQGLGRLAFLGLEKVDRVVRDEVDHPGHAIASRTVPRPGRGSRPRA